MKSSILFLLACLIYLGACQQKISDLLREEFKDPPSFTRPWVYWYWIDENISREGITKDLEAMARVGIGKALIGHVSPGNRPGKVSMLSDQWWEMITHAVSEGGRVGVDIGFFNGPGWSQSGGPWIDEAHAMHYVVNKEIEVTGPSHFSEKLIHPDSLFRPIALLAFPNPTYSEESPTVTAPETASTPAIAGIEKLFDRDTSTALLFPEALQGNEFAIDVDFANPVTAHSIRIDFLPVPFYMDVVLQARINGQFRTVRQFALDRRNINFEIGPMRFDPVAFSVPATSSDCFRLIIKNITNNHGAGIKEMALQPAPVIDEVVEKQLGKMYSDPLPPWDAYVWDNEQTEGIDGIDPVQIIDLTDQLDSSGTLTWNVPEGAWTLCFSGMISTGAKNAPAPAAATGYECDKFSEEAVELHFNSFIGNFIDRVAPEKRTALKTVVIDSYEVGPQNWSDGFSEIFKEKYGYDPIPWLPVLSGRIVKNADLSNRFLWDVRRLTSDLIANNYVQTLRELSNAHGLELWLENYGHWGFPGEFLQYGGQADQVSGEFWFENPYWDLGPLECRAASSAAHTYGKTPVFAEAFTAGFNFRQYPAIMKARGDQMFCEGINHLVHHVYIHQPWEDRKPGVTAWFGMSYNRNNTWFEQSIAWNEYLRRCHYLLQQGLPVSDVCYFIGEDAPKMTGITEPALPRGYDFDFINAEVILNRLSVKNGLLQLPDGKTYKLMVLPPLETMRPDLLKRLRELLEAGANIYGPPPSHSPSLADYPEADTQVSSIADELWGTPNENTAIQKAIGRGKLFFGLPLDKVMEQIDLIPDVVCEDTTIHWTHRKVEETDIYFLSNQEDKAKTIDISFRVSDKIPELWHPDNGSMEAVALFQPLNQQTALPISLDPYGSVFVVFSKPIEQPYVTSISSNSPNTRNDEPKLRYSREGDLLVQSQKEGAYTLTFHDGGSEQITVGKIPAPLILNGPWKVDFNDPWGLTSDTTLNELVAWNALSDPQFKFFSGTASYTKTFQLPEDYLQAGNRLLLDLGAVNIMAEVMLNGQSLGILWKKPWSIDISGSARAGENTLEIRVTNTWWNRLVGDEVYPHGFPGSTLDAPRSFTSTKGWNAASELLPSGLPGPVRIIAEKEVVL